MRRAKVAGATLIEVGLDMKALQKYGMVRVRQLLRPVEEYDGWGVNQHPSRVGDVGVVVDVLHAAGEPDSYVVESAGPGGITLWLGYFREEELDPLPEGGGR